MPTCPSCGKRYADGARGFDTERRRCSSSAACMVRALGPSPAKSEAKRLRRKQTYPSANAGATERDNG